VLHSGHSHPSVVETLKKQAGKFIHSGTKLKPELINNVAEKLLLKANMQGKVFFMNTGSEAIDFALTIAKLSNEKAEITGFTDNYLGAYGQVSSIQNKIDIKECLNCSTKTCNKECLVIKDRIKPHGILIFDPFCFARQVFEIPTKLVEHLKTEMKKKKVTLILDEITAGLGRTGKWFGYQHYDLKPDIVVLGKTLGNGYPVSAVLIDKKIVKLVENKSFTYAQSHQNDPLGCTIAGAVIDTLERERLIEASEKNGQKLLDMLRAELYELKEVVDIRGKGLMLAVELSKNICVTLVYQRLIEKGLIIGISTHYNVLNIFPAYTLPKEKFATIIEKIKEAIKEEASSLAEISALKLKSLLFRY
jgi:acetylornithine/N-succinyldiaminopimelate aminotransferase